MPEQNDGERDPFTQLMFPSRRKREDQISEEASGERMTGHEWLFGKKQSSIEKESDNKINRYPSSIEKALQNVNIPELMNHFDSLMTSTQNLKPLYNQIKPMISNILNKK